MDVQSLSPLYTYHNSSTVKYHFQLISLIFSYGMQLAQVCVYNICVYVCVYDIYTHVTHNTQT